MKLIIIFLSCSLMFGQVVYVAIQDTAQVTVQDTASAEELFLQDIAKKALAKDERRKEITNDLLIIAVIYLLVDKLFIK